MGEEDTVNRCLASTYVHIPVHMHTQEHRNMHIHIYHTHTHTYIYKKIKMCKQGKTDSSSFILNDADEKKTSFSSRKLF